MRYCTGRELIYHDHTALAKVHWKNWQCIKIVHRAHVESHSWEVAETTEIRLDLRHDWCFLTNVGLEEQNMRSAAI